MRSDTRVILTGDRETAKAYIGNALAQLHILEQDMSFQNLSQGVRRVRFSYRTTCKVQVCFNSCVIKIYSKPEKAKIKKETRLGKLYPRFFAFVMRKKENNITSKEYYWLYFTKKKTIDKSKFKQIKDKSPVELSKDFEVYSWQVPGSPYQQMFFKCSERKKDTKVDLLEKMRKVPYYSLSAFTKAFMVYQPEDTKKENGKRYAAAAHLLVSNYEDIFEPIHYPTCIGNWDLRMLPSYPRPEGCYSNNPYYVGLFLMCPPNRFYCNTEKRIMIWYTTKSRNPEIIGDDYLCGVIFNLDDPDNPYFFITYGSYASGSGFTPYWTLHGDSGVPFSMMSEVEKLTNEELVITIQWGERPVRIKEFLNTHTMECEEITHINHRIWIGTGTGFDEIPNIDFDQSFEKPPEDYTAHVTQQGYDCHAYDGECDGCGDDNYHVMELEGHNDFTQAPNDYKKHSTYDIDIYGKKYSVDADREYSNPTDQLVSKLQYCELSMWCRYCFPRVVTLNRTRRIAIDLQVKKGNGVCASWINPNTAYTEAEENMDYNYTDLVFDGYNYGGPSWDDWQERCPFADDDRPITFRCFHGFPNIPCNLWDSLSNERYYGSYGSRTLKRWETKDEDDITEIGEYIIDKKIKLKQEDVDRSYYLDDRATDDNQGIIVAAKHNSDKVLEGSGIITVYEPDSWQIYWKVDWNDEDRSLQGCITPDENINYIGIKDAILKVLDCTENELIELGLV